MIAIAAEVVVRPAEAALATALAAQVAALAGRPEAPRPPAVAATRKAYQALGKDPARYRPAAEALRRRVAQGKGLPAVNNVVDVNNLLSLETGLSIGTYDAASLTPPLLLRPGQPGESYEGIGRGPLNLVGLPLLADEEGPFGSPTSDSWRSRVETGTRHVLMVLFGFAPAPVTAAQLARARELLAAHGGWPVLATELLHGA